MFFRLIVFLMWMIALTWGPASLAIGQENSNPSQDQDSVAPDQDESAESGTSDDDQVKDKDPTADDVMNDAIARARGGDLDGAIELIERAKSLDADDSRIALTLIGVVQARGKELVEQEKRVEANPYFFKAASLVRLLNAEAAEMIGPNAGSVIYDEACAFAVDQNKEKAIASLDEAFELGYDDIDHARHDVNFDSIRESGEFVALLEKHEQRIVAEMLAETKSEFESFETYDFDFNLKDLEGEEIKLQDLKGKVVIVDFWGTWCPPCLAEIPHFIKLKETYGPQGLEVVGLAYENAEDEKVAIQGVKEFAAKKQLNYPCAIGDESTQEMVHGFQGYPTTLFIDRKGIVRLQLVGLHPHAKLEMVVQQLLGGQGE